jgi:hypothetical protein
VADLLGCGTVATGREGAVSGTELIAAERQRQIDVEGYTSAHDEEHDYHDMTDAAICYADASRQVIMAVRWASDPHNQRRWPGECEEIITNPLKDIYNATGPQGWPWVAEDWKPSTDPVRNLVKAGALIAAEIDRLQADV